MNAIATNDFSMKTRRIAIQWIRSPDTLACLFKSVMEDESKTPEVAAEEVKVFLAAMTNCRGEGVSGLSGQLAKEVISLIDWVDVTKAIRGSLRE